MNAKTATDLLIKLSAANQKEALKGPVCVKEEPQAEGNGRAAHIAQRPHETMAKSGLLCQDISSKVASELLMKLSVVYHSACSPVAASFNTVAMETPGLTMQIGAFGDVYSRVLGWPPSNGVGPKARARATGRTRSMGEGGHRSRTRAAPSVRRAQVAVPSVSPLHRGPRRGRGRVRRELPIPARARPPFAI
ncbi:hypothetical protein SKAU_G00390310 [Synaphobranchus kaupii]|uniref:Uncharacterized protein n=1 Tax=Synaphobranchus kaupii TaxID=118154 RepID=A0A9Q1EBC4_SYNKA|nr:hypothetical protein SKAU_G00390310 [Synaphobranchus kaupii]